MITATNVIDASALQTTSMAVNVSAGAPPAMGSVLMATSMMTATWQVPTVAITTPRTTMVNSPVLWGDITGDTLMQASIKITDMMFKNTSDKNILVIDQVHNNTCIGIRTFANVTTGGANATIDDDTLNAITTGNFNMALSMIELQFLTTGNMNVFVGSALSYITTGGSNIEVRVGAGLDFTISESNNIIICTNVAGIAGESNII
jgi:hypothetical protein